VSVQTRVIRRCSSEILREFLTERAKRCSRPLRPHGTCEPPASLGVRWCRAAEDKATRLRTPAHALLQSKRRTVFSRSQLRERRARRLLKQQRVRPARSSPPDSQLTWHRRPLGCIRLCAQAHCAPLCALLEKGRGVVGRRAHLQNTGASSASRPPCLSRSAAYGHRVTTSVRSSPTSPATPLVCASTTNDGPQSVSAMRCATRSSAANLSERCHGGRRSLVSAGPCKAHQASRRMLTLEWLQFILWG